MCRRETLLDPKGLGAPRNRALPLSLAFRLGRRSRPESEHGRYQPFASSLHPSRLTPVSHCKAPTQGVTLIFSAFMATKYNGKAFRRIVRGDGAAWYDRSGWWDGPNTVGHGTAERGRLENPVSLVCQHRESPFPLPWLSPCEACATCINGGSVHLTPSQLRAGFSTTRSRDQYLYRVRGRFSGEVISARDNSTSTRLDGQSFHRESENITALSESRPTRNLGVNRHAPTWGTNAEDW
ncbi:hypothetical protein QBC39DRAFT_68788 [Podospora conica]|nr:hypothetical protein QBC39DRAFT_68788 [Schizothecium conicum]